MNKKGRKVILQVSCKEELLALVTSLVNGECVEINIEKTGE